MRLYAARLGLVSQPHPRGALKPKDCRTYRFRDVRAAIRPRSDGLLIPHFIDYSDSALHETVAAADKRFSIPSQLPPPASPRTLPVAYCITERCWEGSLAVPPQQTAAAHAK